MPNTGEFRTILHQVKDINEKLSQQESLAEAVEVVGGNLTVLGDEVFVQLKRMESQIGDVKKAMARLESKIEEMRGLMENGSQMESCQSQALTPMTKRRKIQRNPDLSYHVREKLTQLQLAWDTSLKENDPVNVEISTKLLREVGEIDDVRNNALCTERRIKDAISSTYKTAKKRERRAENGSEESYRKKQRKLQRIDRKLKRRIHSIATEEKESERAQAVHISFISSDESDDEQPGQLITKPIPWRHDDLNTYFKELDNRYQEGLSLVQKRMMSNRVEGQESERTHNSVPQSLRVWVKD